jgi:hypothetical protein
MVEAHSTVRIDAESEGLLAQYCAENNVPYSQAIEEAIKLLCRNMGMAEALEKNEVLAVKRAASLARVSVKEFMTRALNAEVSMIEARHSEIVPDSRSLKHTKMKFTRLKSLPTTFPGIADLRMSKLVGAMMEANIENHKKDPSKLLYIQSTMVFKFSKMNLKGIKAWFAKHQQEVDDHHKQMGIVESRSFNRGKNIAEILGDRI